MLATTGTSCSIPFQLVTRPSVLSLQHEGFFARAKVGGLEQRKPAKRSARGLALVVRCQDPGKPPPDSSQIFLRAKKRASSSDDNESLRGLLQFLNTTFGHLKFVLDSFLRIEFHMKREKSSCCKNQSEQTRRPLQVIDNSKEKRRVQVHYEIVSLTVLTGKLLKKLEQ